MPDINSDIQYLKGVGPAYAKKFAKLGIYTIRDLLLHYPRRYIDYSQPYTVVSAPFDVDCCVKATVLQRDPDRRIKGCLLYTSMPPATASLTVAPSVRVRSWRWKTVRSLPLAATLPR